MSKRIIFGVAISVMAHLAFATAILLPSQGSVTLNHGIKAFDTPRVSLSIRKKTQQKIVEVADNVIAQKPPVESQVEDDVLDQNKDDARSQESIPMVEHASFVGKRVPPVYPKRALMLKQEGVVMLKALIGIDGGINDLQLLRSSGYSILDHSAMDAVREWKFKPLNKNGKPLLSWMKVPVEFVIR